MSQFNQFVIGAETDFQGSSISGQGNSGFPTLYPTFYGNPTSNYLTPVGALNGANINLAWFGTVRGRAGYLITPTLLLYGTAGFAYGQVDAWGWSNTRTGWTAGGGVEWMFAPHWTAKAEYLYVDLSSNGATGSLGWSYGYNFHPQINVVRVGVNYLFNFAPRPRWSPNIDHPPRNSDLSRRTDREGARPLRPGFSFGAIAAPFPKPDARNGDD